MELLKKNIHMMNEKSRAVSQLTLDEDCNVPDSLPDVERIIQSKETVRVEDIQAGADKVTISGYVQICVLYTADTAEHQIQRLDTRIPFLESQMLEGAAGKENVHVRWETEDISVAMINSRKLSIKALLLFTSTLDEVYDVSAAVELHGIPEISAKTREMELLQMALQKRDILRVKEEITVPSNKPNIARILWESVQLRGTDARTLDGKLALKGELFVFVLYEGDDESRTKQWLETALPFQSEMECAGCMADMTSEIEMTLSQYTVEALADYDGERRLITLDAVLDLDIKLYAEERVRILEDVYSPVRGLVPVREPQVYESLLMKNFSKVRASERLRLGASQPRMLQTCSSRGEVKLDDARISGEGIVVEGAVSVTTMYVSSDDKAPYAVLEGAVPFTQTIEIRDISPDCRFRLHTEVEQLSVTMIDSEEIEVKASVSLNAFVVRVHRENCITEIEDHEPDMKKLQEMPGMVGYIVQPQDSLWEIAKRYYTTPERICRLNEIEEKDFRPGMKLVILKTVN